MNDTAFEFNRQLELDVMISGLTEVTQEYVYNNMLTLKETIDEIVIPVGVKKLGDWAFSWHDGIKSITIPDGVTGIGKFTFNSCNSLKSIMIPDSVWSIGDQAFNYCISLKNVTIGNKVESIGINAFWQCSSLRRVTFKGKTLDEVRSMKYYPWRLSPEKIHVQVS